MHRQGIELGVIAHRRVLQVLEKRAEKEQRRIRFDGLRRLRQIQAPTKYELVINLKTAKAMLFCRGKITMQGTAFILIRSVVPNPDDRKAFDHWYETDHFPLVLSKINITQGWRFWSHSDPAVHYALVEFSGMDVGRRKFLATLGGAAAAWPPAAQAL